jgi:hypothetical protein
MHACMHTYIHASIHACIYTYIHACIHACEYSCMHIYIHTYINACIHTYTHAPAHPRPRTHTYLPTFLPTHPPTDLPSFLPSFLPLITSYSPSNKIPWFCGRQKPSLYLLLGRKNATHVLTPQSIRKFHFNIILPHRSRSLPS